MLLPEAGNLEKHLESAGMGLSETKIQALSQSLMDKALVGFESLPSCFYGNGVKESMQNFAKHFTMQGKTPASEMRRILTAKGVDTLSMNIWDEISDKWMEYSRG